MIFKETVKNEMIQMYLVYLYICLLVKLLLYNKILLLSFLQKYNKNLAIFVYQKMR